MDKIKRNERLTAIVKILTESPNRIITLNYFSELFGAAKSTISEDIMIAKGIFEKFDLGYLETITGAAGGVKYLPFLNRKKSYDFINDMCGKLSDPHRILPGGFIYMVDILSIPYYVERMGQILAAQFYETAPDMIVTVETKGIPIGLMTARALNVPLIVARRDNKITEGSVVTINYLSASTRQIQTMSLSKRAVKEGQRALIIDDFMKGGGTAKGIYDLMKEFNVTIAGTGIMVATKEPDKKLVSDYKALMILKNVNELEEKAEIEPADWLKS